MADKLKNFMKNIRIWRSLKVRLFIIIFLMGLIPGLIIRASILNIHSWDNWCYWTFCTLFWNIHGTDSADCIDAMFCRKNWKATLPPNIFTGKGVRGDRCWIPKKTFFPSYVPEPPFTHKSINSQPAGTGFFRRYVRIGTNFAKNFRFQVYNTILFLHMQAFFEKRLCFHAQKCYYHTWELLTLKFY